MLKQRSFSEFSRILQNFFSQREIQNVVGMVEVGTITHNWGRAWGNWEGSV